MRCLAAFVLLLTAACGGPEPAIGVLLPTGGVVIDTPGLREVQLWDDGGLEIAFPEIADAARGCRFGDCVHAGEPGCAVAAALEAGEIDPARVRRWLKLAAEEAHNTATIAERRSRDKSRQRMYNDGKKRGRSKRGG